MKVYRVCYWTGMVCALLYALYSGSRFCWLLFLVQLLVLVAALGINLWTAYSFSYVQQLSDEQGEKGQTVELHIGIYNDKPFPFTHMRVTVQTPDPAERQTLPIDLAPKTSCAYDLQLSLPMRGEYLVGMTRLELQDVFGLLPMSFDLRLLPYYRQRPLLVLPRVDALTLSGGRTGTAEHGLNSNLIGQEEYSYLRGWIPGDRLSRVHWSASAKTGTLFTRQYEDPAGGSCLIFLDCQTLGDAEADRLTECAATLLCAHLRQGDFVDLRAGSPQARPVQRAFALGDSTAMRQWLASLKFNQTDAGIEVLIQSIERETYGQIYVLGGRFHPEILRVLEDLNAPAFYWLAEPLPAGQVSRRVPLAAMTSGELTDFLRRHLEEKS